MRSPSMTRQSRRAPRVRSSLPSRRLIPPASPVARSDASAAEDRRIREVVRRVVAFLRPRRVILGVTDPDHAKAAVFDDDPANLGQIGPLLAGQQGGASVFAQGLQHLVQRAIAGHAARDFEQQFQVAQAAATFLVALGGFPFRAGGFDGLVHD